MENSIASAEIRILQAEIREKAHVKDIERVEEKVEELKTKKAEKAEVIYLKEQLDGKVSTEAFNPVRAVVYGMVGLILVAVGTGIIALVI